jgi:hypothetical protein
VAGFAAEPIARIEKDSLAVSIDQLTISRRVPEWMDSSARSRALALFKRNVNGIGRTDIKFSDSAPLTTIVESKARIAVSTLEDYDNYNHGIDADFSRSEIGSIEGDVISAIPYYGHPAFFVKERLTGIEVPCVIPDELESKIGLEHNWSEVWSNRRVGIIGEIRYGEDGKIRRVSVLDIKNIDPPMMKYEDISDPSFTGGLSPSEYIDLSRRQDGA